MELLDGYQYLLKFNGSWILENPAELDMEKYLIVRGEFEYGLEKKDPKTEKYIIDVSPTRLEFVAGDKVLTGKVKSTASKRLRGSLWHKYQELYPDGNDFDVWYESQITKMIININSILEL